MLTSVWRVPAPLTRTWGVLADPALTWPRWWRGVSATDVSPAADGLVGSGATMTFRAALGYGLRVRLTIDGAEAGRWVSVRTSGDLVGAGLVRLEAPSADSTRIEVTWDVTTTPRWMNATAPVLGRAFAASHARLMRTGERGLAAYLAARPAAVTVTDR